MSTSGAGDRTAPGTDAAKATRDGHDTVPVVVRYFASARAAAGVESEVVRLSRPASVADAVEHLRERHPGQLPRILDASGFLLDGIAVRDLSRPLPDDAELDVLPPFAGG